MAILLIVLLLAIIWLLWTLHQDLLEANQRQRNSTMEIIRLFDRVERVLVRENENRTEAQAGDQVPPNAKG